jgi:hypothetical protein
VQPTAGSQPHVRTGRVAEAKPSPELPATWPGPSAESKAPMAAATSEKAVTAVASTGDAHEVRCPLRCRAQRDALQVTALDCDRLRNEGAKCTSRIERGTRWVWHSEGKPIRASSSTASTPRRTSTTCTRTRT